MLSPDRHKDLLVAKAHRTSLFGATGFSFLLAATAVMFAAANSPPESALAEPTVELETVYVPVAPEDASLASLADQDSRPVLPSYAQDLIDLRILEAVGAQPSIVVPSVPFPAHAPTRNREPQAGPSEAAPSPRSDDEAGGKTSRLVWNQAPPGLLRVPAD